MNYSVHLHEEARKMIAQLDKSVKEHIIKRIARMRNEPVGRHMRGSLDFFVEEVGQYRIIYTCEIDLKEIFFIGKHKDYEKWYTGRK